MLSHFGVLIKLIQFLKQTFLYIHRVEMEMVKNYFLHRCLWRIPLMNENLPTISIRKNYSTFKYIYIYEERDKERESEREREQHLDVNRCSSVRFVANVAALSLSLLPPTPMKLNSQFREFISR